jgi:basic membrane lipoprotein Med (substrate-binding protein (PBP1-ABC) superfamily)
VVWDFTQIDTELIQAVRMGRWSEEHLQFETAWVCCRRSSSADVWSKVETAKQAIIDGSIQVPLTTNMKQVKKMIASQQ